MNPTHRFALAASIAFALAFAPSPARCGPDPAPDIVITGEDAGDEDAFGWSVAPAGDVNGDGNLDIVIGAPTNDAIAGFAGRAYLFHGPFAGNRPAAGADAKITAQAFGDNLGVSVCSAGDVNGDGKSDLLIGARGQDAPGIQAGRVYLFLGPVSGNLQATSASAIISGVEFEELGWSVAAGGDLNADGRDDIVIGAPDFSGSAGVAQGRAYVFFGPISGSRASSSADVIIEGEVADNQLGACVASAGDVNDDGKDDLVVGAPDGPLVPPDPGQAYVFLGPLSSGTRSAATADFILLGEQDNDLFGTIVSAAGDVNGDGFGDVLVGAPQTFNEGEGRAYLFHGPLEETLNGVPSGPPAAILVGEVANDAFGTGIGGAGDVNGDGFDDVLIGAWDNAAGGGRAGRAYLSFGPLAGTIDAASADVIFTGPVGGDELGYSVAGAGDLDEDGLADLLIGAPQFFDGDPGKAHIHFAGPVVTSVGGASTAASATTLRLDRGAPNPFRPFTDLSFNLPERGPARLAVYDASGRLVRLLLDAELPAGAHAMRWNGASDRGEQVASGTYILRLQADSAARSRTLVRLR